MDMAVRADLDAGVAGGLLTIDLDALVDNYRQIAGRAGSATAAAVVKADAYGLGAERVAPALERAGCRHFFVAHFGEAVALRPHLAASSTLYVLNGLLPGSETACAVAGIVPVLNSLDQIAAWAAMAVRTGRVLPAALQADTGMSRLGLSPEELAVLEAEPARLAGLRIDVVMSHLACADEPMHPANRSQLARMRAVRALFPAARLSFANSGGVFLGADFAGDLVRPGIALYGGAPVAGQPNPMRPVVRLDLAVIQTRTVPAGAGIGYGASLVADRPMRLAVIAAGYADGLPRCLSGRGAAYRGGVRLPIAGRVSMDSIILDASALPDGALKLGDMVEMIGPHQSLEDVAGDAGTIAYEILTSLGRRYARAYVGGEVN